MLWEPFIAPGGSHVVGAARRCPRRYNLGLPAAPPSLLDGAGATSPPFSAFALNVREFLRGPPALLVLLGARTTLSRRIIPTTHGVRMRSAPAHCLHGVSHSVGLSAASSLCPARQARPGCPRLQRVSDTVGPSAPAPSALQRHPTSSSPPCPIGRRGPTQPPGPWPLPRTGGRFLCWHSLLIHQVLGCTCLSLVHTLYNPCTPIGQHLDTPRPAYPRLQ